jgi:outer membrane murein-binding lipoprotein Lpp
MNILQRRQALTAEVSPARVQALQSKIMAFYQDTEAAAKQFRATGKKPAKLKIGALKYGR